ncbi:hypothetical protein WME98_21235 [Sorangium sp. So ce296]|uniref:hypothetical protein n=1 Tax=Sorangium sp. So ce296 TaxID=3133296 RepID=UPI003F5F1ACC
MRVIRFLLASLLCALAMLPARAAWAAIAVTFVEPGQRAWSHTYVNIHVEVSSTLQIARVQAQLGAGSVILTNTGGITYKAGISTFGLPYGEHVLTVTATDVEGTSVSAQRTVFQDQIPTAQVLAPTHEAVAHPSLRLAATCVDDHPADCSIRATANFYDTNPSTSVELARATAALDTVVDLSAYSGRKFDLKFQMVDIHSSMILLGPTIQVETSPLLEPIDEVPGRILDFDGTRILFVKRREELFVLDRATRATTRVMKLPYPYQFNDATRAFLTGAGAVMEVPAPPAIDRPPSAVYEWRHGALLKLAENGRVAFVSGDAMAYSGSGTYVRDLASGTDELALGAALDRPSMDVADDGLFAYVNGRWSLYTRRNGTSTLLATSGDEITRPVTDGINVVFTKILRSGQPQSILATPSGQVPLGVVPVARPEGAQTGAYQLHAGYIAFLKGSRGAEQVWLRTPSGAQHQLSSSTPSQLDDPPARLGHDGISDTGEVMFLTPPKRYLGAAGAAPREIGSQLGHARWFEGAWYVVMGNTLFRVDDGSSGEGEGDGEREGAGEAGGSTGASFASARAALSTMRIGEAGARVASAPAAAPPELPEDELPASSGCALAAQKPGLGGALEAAILATLGLAMAARRRPRLRRDRGGADATPSRRATPQQGSDPPSPRAAGYSCVRASPR